MGLAFGLRLLLLVFTPCLCVSAWKTWERDVFPAPCPSWQAGGLQGFLEWLKWKFQVICLEPAALLKLPKPDPLVC